MNLRSVLSGAAVLLALLPSAAPGQSGGSQRQPASELAHAHPAALPVKPSAAPVLQPFHELTLSSLSQRVPVLTYHDVIRSRSQPDAVWFDCTAAEFEAQMKFLHDHGAVVITLEQLRRHLTQGEKLPDRAIALTFDDGYQGVYTNAAPVLTRYGYPYAVFPHTDYVGNQQGRPKMTWDELRDLDSSGLVTIGGHSTSHPADMGLLSTARQDAELRNSKSVLEEHLGHPVEFVSYPNGKASTTTFERARLAGYTLGFMEEWGVVEQSPRILALNRYIHLQLKRAWDEAYGPDPVLASASVTLSASLPITTRKTVAAGVHLTLKTGGTLSSQLARPAAGGHPLVSTDFLTPDRTTGVLRIWVGSQAGAPPGPLLTQRHAFVPEAHPARLGLLQGRPLVVWNRERLSLLPFVPQRMNTSSALQAFMPGLEGAFVAGAWLVQHGQPLSSAGILAHATRDLRTLRSRVFLGVTGAGVPVLGISSLHVNVHQLAWAAVAAGTREAVLVY